MFVLVLKRLAERARAVILLDEDCKRCVGQPAHRGFERRGHPNRTDARAFHGMFEIREHGTVRRERHRQLEQVAEPVVDLARFRLHIAKLREGSLREQRVEKPRVYKSIKRTGWKSKVRR